MNSLRNILGGSSPIAMLLQNISAWAGQFRQFAANPVQAIMSMKNVNVPKDFNGGPEELVKYLISTGQMTQQDYETFAQSVNQVKPFLPKF